MPHALLLTGTKLWQVTRENRDELPRRALLWLDAGGHL
jgi:hypothetical protein